MASYARSLTGTQPGIAPVAYSASTATYASTRVFYTGVSPGTLTARLAVPRSLTGAQPFATGVLTRRLAAKRTLTGAQPTALGTLTRRLTAPRALTGAQPAAGGTLARLKAAPRSLTGAQPTALGTLTKILTALRTFAGLQPTAHGVVSNDAEVSRMVFGVQPAPGGLLSKRLTAFKTLPGTQPASGGTLSTQKIVARTLTGTQPAATGTLTASLITASTRFLSGTQPVTLPVAYADPAVRYRESDVSYRGGRSPGVLHAQFNADFYVVVSGVQPGAEGTLSQRAVLHRLVGGVQAAASGMLAWIRTWVVYVVPGHEQGTTPDTYVHVQDFGTTYQHHQSQQPAEDAPGYLLVPYADPNTTYADPAVVYQGRPVPEATAVQGVSTYRHGQDDMVQSTYVAKQEITSRMETR